MMEDDLKEEKSEAEVCNCAEGSWMRKLVPHLEEEMLSESLRGTLE